MERATIPFVKMHGLGNDYVYLDEREGPIPDPARWAPILSDRHRGIGSDGVIVLRQDPDRPVRMEMVNADGSRSGMCGNGIRCVARLARERGYATKDAFVIAVEGGSCPVRILREGGEISAIAVDLGVPLVERAPVTVSGGRNSRDGDWGELTGTVVDVGNPHFVHTARTAVEEFPLERFGPAVERHPRFPHRTNVGVVEVVARDHLRLRVWERGTGETRACGSGATAAAAALRAAGEVDDLVRVSLPGGDLMIEFDAKGHAWMTGPAEESFRGAFPRSLVP